ncbi:MAG TPA: hypothetical protein PK205_07270 [Promineifilum sp.]|nr:hypothetical protein [Promineifilum sp.]
MSYPSWPSALPRCGSVSVTGNPQPNNIVFKPEVGPPITRRRASGVTKLRSVTFRVLTREQYDDFVDFFETDLKDGTSPFYWVDPMTDDGETLPFSTLVRIVMETGQPPYQEERLTPDQYSITFQVMVYKYSPPPPEPEPDP